MVWVFQQGNLGFLVGSPVVTGTLDTTIPILMFCVLLGLGTALAVLVDATLIRGALPQRVGVSVPSIYLHVADAAAQGPSARRSSRRCGHRATPTSTSRWRTPSTTGSS